MRTASIWIKRGLGTASLVLVLPAYSHCLDGGEILQPLQRFCDMRMLADSLDTLCSSEVAGHPASMLPAGRIIRSYKYCRIS